MKDGIFKDSSQKYKVSCYSVIWMWQGQNWATRKETFSLPNVYH